MKLVLLFAFGLALLPLFATLRRRRTTAVVCWAASGVILWATGMALILGEQSRALLQLSHVAGPVSACLFWIGALRFTRRTPSRWLPAIGAAGALATGLCFVALGRAAAVAAETAFSFPMLAASAWLVNAHAWRTRASLPEKALGAALVVLAVVMPADVVSRLFVDADAILLPIWATLSFSIALLTVAALAERASDRSWRLTRELEARTAALDLERRSLLAVLESSPLGIAVADPEGSVRYLNLRGAELLGSGPPAKWEGRPVAELVRLLRTRLTPASRARIGALARGLLGERAIVSGVELELDGGDRVLDLLSHSVAGEHGEGLGRVWLCRDVTEERRVEERLAQAQRMETVGTLAGGIAHDFNNQLTAILANVERLLGGLPEGDDRRGAAEAVERSALHCADLTQGLLAFARRRPRDVSDVPVDALVRELTELVRPGLPPDVVLSVVVAEDVGFLRANGDELRRVLMNLLVNARDAVGERGSIQIQAWRRAVAGMPDTVEIEVSDDGVGMDEATRRRIFDPFFTTKQLGRGTGLGLAVAYGIAKAHGARLEVESAPRAGSCFRLSWPATAPVDAALTPPVVAPATAAGQTVLVGEDEPEVRQSLRRMLESAGFRVIEAVDGRQVVDLFRQHRGEVDALLLDLAMPGRGGLDALVAVRALAPALPVVLTSGNPDRFVEDLPADADLLLKPFTSRTLATRIQAAIDASAAE